ncbi:autotransporter domain-containing protein [Parasphingorhabdus sp.]|uniref:autotransporter domain-containing protein n=1 Tax=Parasphingorhabdus sp. TaxID=2709688 RepID=UPI0035946BC2
MLKSSTALNSGASFARISFGRTTVAGAIVLASLALAPSASAQNECGIPDSDTVTCSPDDNPYANGITYLTADELTIILEDGVVVDTSAGFNSGLLLLGGDEELTVNGATNTSITAGQFGFAVLAATNAGDLTLNLDQVSGILSGINASSASGTVTVNANDVTTSGDRATGISASGNSGDVFIDVGTVTTTGANSGGIVANTAGDITINFDSVTSTGTGVSATGGSNSVVSVNGGDVTTSGDNAAGILARGNFAIGSTGSINVAADNVSTEGTAADGINVESRFSTATVDAGTVNTTGDNARGIVAIGGAEANIAFDSVTTSGNGATGILVPSGSLFVRPTAIADISGGNVSTNGDDAIGIAVAAGTTATVDVDMISTTGNGSTGLSVAPGTGGLFGTADTPSATLLVGSVSTTGDNAAGIDASVTDDLFVTVGSVSTSGDTSSALLATTTGGNVTATVDGAVLATGANSDGLVVNSGGNATVNIGNGGSFAVSQGDSIVMNSAGVSTLNNAGMIGNNAGGLAVLATGGPITINNSGTLSSDIVLTSGADRINNSGTFLVGVNPDFGTGADVFNNSGLIRVGSGAAVMASPTFTGLESLTNSGTIDLRDGGAGDTLTLPGTYAGANGTLGLDVLLDGTTNLSDELIIGGLASGTTTVELNRLGDSAPLFNPGTILVRAATGSEADAFDLAGGSLDAGFVRYEVQYDPANGTYALTGAPSDAAFRTLNYAEGVRSIWLKSADVISAQLRARRDTLWAQGDSTPSGRLWMQMHGSVEQRESQRDFNAFGQSRNVDIGYEQDYFGGQLGLDIAGGSGERGGFAAGITAGYINSSLNFAGSTDRMRFDVVNGGAYASYSAGNFFVNALGKYDYYWADAQAGNLGFQQDFNGGVYGARGEAGFRFGSDSFFVEPAASISYVKNDLDDLTPAGTTVSFDDDDGLRGRAGARIGGQFDVGASKMAVYAGANYVHEFKGQDNVTFTSGGQTLSFANDRLRDYGEATLGLTIAQSEAVSGFIEGNYIRSFNKDAGNLGIEGAGGRAGIRVKF